jgi:hypothetical protein
MRKIVTAMAATFVLVAGLCSSSLAIPPLEDLPRGGDTVVPHLVLATPPVVEASGVSIPMPPEVTEGHPYVKLVGHTDLGWLVAAQAFEAGDGWMTSDTLHLVTATGSTEIFSVDFPTPKDQNTHYRLGPSRKRVIRWVDGNEASDFTILDLSGNVLVHRPLIRGDAWVWDFSGTRVVYDRSTGGTWSWIIGHSPRRLTDRVVRFADIGNNTLVVVRGDHYKAFATLTHPGRFRWQARFFPSLISPDGRRVAGWADKHDDIIQVRGMSDGKVLTSLYVANVGAHRNERLRWEGNAAVVFQARYDNGDAVLVRCTLAKVCARVTDRAPGFYFPHRPGTYGY